MFGMTTMERSGTPADIAAERAAIEAEIEGTTLLTAYAETVAAAGDTPAHRWLDGGEWRSLTYRQVYEQVRDLTLGLGVLGFRPGEFAVIWSRNRSEATIADYAVMHARGVPVFIYNTVSAEQAAYIAGHCEAAVAIVEREFLPKLLTVWDELPKLRQIVLIDGEADRAIGWPQLLGLGHAEAERSPDLFGETWRQVRPVDLATLIYTSGTTGQPKAVMLTHYNLRYNQQATLRVIPLEQQSDDDGNARLVSYLPMAHVTGRSLDHWGAIGPRAHPRVLPGRAPALRDRGSGPPDRADQHPAGVGEAVRRAAHGPARRVAVRRWCPARGGAAGDTDPDRP